MRLWLVIGCLFAAACDGDRREFAGGDFTKEAPPAVVEVHIVSTGSVVKMLDSHAVLESVSQADLYPTVASQVLSVKVDEGQSVKSGQVLAVLESVSQGAGAERADADVSKLKRDLTHTETLHQRGAVSDQDLEEARYQLQTALSSAREARHSYGQTRITAPFDGVVAVRDVRVGEVAQAGTRAFQVVDLQNLRVVSQLPERDLKAVKIGQPARLISAYDASLVSSGVVSVISPVVDPTTGTFRVTVTVDKEQAALRPGQFVTVQLEVERHDGVPVVPKSAILWEGGVSYVYRKSSAPIPDKEEPDAKGGFKLFGGVSKKKEKEPSPPVGPIYSVERVVLELGLRDESYAEVMTGLALGDEVVVIGQTGLRDGASIRLPVVEDEAVEDTSDDDAEALD